MCIPVEIIYLQAGDTLFLIQFNRFVLFMREILWNKYYYHIILPNGFTGVIQILDEMVGCRFAEIFALPAQSLPDQRHR